MLMLLKRDMPGMLNGRSVGERTLAAHDIIGLLGCGYIISTPSRVMGGSHITK